MVSFSNSEYLHTHGNIQEQYETAKKNVTKFWLKVFENNRKIFLKTSQAALLIVANSVDNNDLKKFLRKQKLHENKK